jgi:Ig-like domain-containing protein
MSGLAYEKRTYGFSKGVCFIQPIDTGSLINPAILRQKCFKELKTSKSDLSISDVEIDKSGISFVVNSDVYAHAVYFGLDGEVEVSDEYFDLFPNEKRKIIISDLKPDFMLAELKPRC